MRNYPSSSSSPSSISHIHTAQRDGNFCWNTLKKKVKWLNHYNDYVDQKFENHCDKFDENLLQVCHFIRVNLVENIFTGPCFPCFSTTDRMRKNCITDQTADKKFTLWIIVHFIKQYTILTLSINVPASVNWFDCYVILWRTWNIFTSHHSVIVIISMIFIIPWHDVKLFSFFNENKNADYRAKFVHQWRSQYAPHRAR